MSPWVTDCTRISQNPKLDDPQRLMRGWRPTSWEWIFFIPSWYDDPFWHMYILLYIICVCMHVLYTDICWWFLRMISKRCVGATKQHEFSFTLRCYGQNLDQSWKSLVFFLVFNGILSRILMAWTAWYLLNIRCMVSAWLRTFYSQTPDAMALSEPPFLSDAVDTGGGFPWFGLVGL